MYLLLSLGRGGCPSGDGVRNCGLWWTKEASEGVGLTWQCYCLAGDYVWVADMERKLLVVMRVVLGSQSTITGGETKHN